MVNCLPTGDSGGSAASNVDGRRGDSIGRDSQDGGDSSECVQVVQVQGLDTLTVVGISFAAFVLGVLLTAALWLIHTHTGLLSFIITRKHTSQHHSLF